MQYFNIFVFIFLLFFLLIITSGCSMNIDPSTVSGDPKHPWYPLPVCIGADPGNYCYVPIVPGSIITTIS